jgi:hypothetical protein
MNTYEFTLPVSRKEAEKWYGWFEGRGIPVALFGKDDVYIVWRWQADRMRSDPARAGFKLVKRANDFPINNRRARK